MAKVELDAVADVTEDGETKVGVVAGEEVA